MYGDRGGTVVKVQRDVVFMVNLIVIFLLLLLPLLLLLLPLALQSTVGFGLSNNVLPFFPICQSSHSRPLSTSCFHLFLGLPLLLPSSS